MKVPSGTAVAQWSDARLKCAWDELVAEVRAHGHTELKHLSMNQMRRYLVLFSEIVSRGSQLELPLDYGSESS